MRKFAFFAVLATVLFSFSYDSPAENTNTLKLLSLFGDVFEKVRDEYVEETSDDKLIEAAINGMLTSLDPHSSYLPAKAFEDIKIQTKGEFGGLGIEVTMEGGLVKVVAPMDDTPAAKAGLKSGDLISHINGESVSGLSLAEAVDKMRGEVGSKIRLTVLRKGAKEPMEFTLVRAVIKIQSVRSKLFDDIGYIRISSFTEQTGKGVRLEFDKLKREAKELAAKHKDQKNGAAPSGELRGLVLDLRNNPGGLLDQAIDVTSAFIEEGEVVSTRGRRPESVKRYNASGGDITGGLPIAILINGGSASASEIVSGALQDHKRAVVLGTKSFGKGSVQSVIPLPQNTAMRLTTSRYYTPSGHSIQAKGITPDIIVDSAKIEYVKTDREDSEASLRGHLSNTDGEKKIVTMPEEGNTGDAESNRLKDDSGTEGGSAKKSPINLVYEQDYQLARAIDLLRAVSVFGKSTTPVSLAPKGKAAVETAPAVQ